MTASRSIKTGVWAPGALPSPSAAGVSHAGLSAAGSRRWVCVLDMTLRPQRLEQPDQFRTIGHFFGELVVDGRRGCDECLLADLVDLQIRVGLAHLRRQRAAQGLPLPPGKVPALSSNPPE